LEEERKGKKGGKEKKREKGRGKRERERRSPRPLPEPCEGAWACSPGAACAQEN